LFIAFSDDHRSALIPVDVTAPQITGFVDAQPCIRQGEQKGSVTHCAEPNIRIIWQPL
jgi:hypothetical protein